MFFDRVRRLDSAETPPNGRYVLDWAHMNRRVESNHARSFAVDMANELLLPDAYIREVTQGRLL